MKKILLLVNLLLTLLFVSACLYYVTLHNAEIFQDGISLQVPSKISLKMPSLNIPTRRTSQITPITTPENTPTKTLAAPTATFVLTFEPTLVTTPTVDVRLKPENWREWPVIPNFSMRAVEIYKEGLLMGNDPQHFSKVGDCQSTTGFFLGVFDNPRGVKEYRLGEKYAYLQETIDFFEGSFIRQSRAVKGGSNVAYVLNPLHSDPEDCLEGESPLECEIRLYRPSFAIVRMEKWGRKPIEDYEKYMRQIIEILIANGVVPILTTKVDNSEGDHSVNFTIAKLAYEYDVPMWNFWAAAYPLPDHGLRLDGFHLKVGYIHFDNVFAMQLGWPVCNLTALQSLNAAMEFVFNQEIMIFPEEMFKIDDERSVSICK